MGADTRFIVSEPLRDLTGAGTSNGGLVGARATGRAGDQVLRQRPEHDPGIDTRIQRCRSAPRKPDPFGQNARRPSVVRARAGAAIDERFPCDRRRCSGPAFQEAGAMDWR